MKLRVTRALVIASFCILSYQCSTYLRLKYEADLELKFQDGWIDGYCSGYNQGRLEENMNVTYKHNADACMDGKIIGECKSADGSCERELEVILNSI